MYQKGDWVMVFMPPESTAWALSGIGGADKLSSSSTGGQTP